MMTIEITSSSAEATEEIATKIAKNLRGGEVLELISDLGGGKTTFAKGLLVGLGGGESASSPTFTISHEYTTGRLPIHHFDLYRLQSGGVMLDELAEVIAERDAVVVVEWADVVQDVLPEQRLRISLQATDITERKIKIYIPETMTYVGEGLV